MRMKKTKTLCLAAIAALAMTLYPQSVQAQDEVDEFGIFDHVSAGLVIGTTGIGIDVAAPISEYVQVRAGYNFFPTFKYKEARKREERRRLKERVISVPVICCLTCTPSPSTLSTPLQDSTLAPMKSPPSRTSSP